MGYFKERDTVTIGTRGVFTIRAVDALEGGGWGLTLEPAAGGAFVFEEVYRHRDGVLRTEDFGAVTVGSPGEGVDHAEAVKPATSGVADEAPEPGQLDLFGGGVT